MRRPPRLRSRPSKWQTYAACRRAGQAPGEPQYPSICSTSTASCGCVCVCVLKCLRDYGHAGLCADPCMHVWPSILMTGWTMTGTESIIFSLGMHNSINRHCKAHTKILSGFPSACTFCHFCPNCPLKYPEYQEEEKKLIIIKSHKKRGGIIEKG